MRDKKLYVYTQKINLDPMSFFKLDGKKSVFIHPTETIVGIIEEITFQSNEKNAFTHLMSWTEDIFSKIIFYGDYDIPPRMIGGFSFDQKLSSAIWEKFPRAHFTLHRLTIIRRKDSEENFLQYCRLSKRRITEKEMREEMEKALLHKNASKESHKIKIGDYTSIPNKVGWIGMIKKIKEKITKGEVEKVVLARTRKVQYTGLNPLHMFEKLLLNYGENTCFMYSIDEEIFLGASPETLIRKNGKKIMTEALAGSAPKGRTEEEEKQIINNLIVDKKNLIEHKIVVERIVNSLSDRCKEIRIGKLDVKSLSYINHLNTKITGELYPDSNIIELVGILHPTPALGGHPQEPARRAIREVEIQGRGWYGSPFGWVDTNGDGQFIVAIRSALIKQEGIFLFTGAGIVENSVPEKEWEETELKLHPMIKILESL